MNNDGEYSTPDMSQARFSNASDEMGLKSQTTLPPLSIRFPFRLE